MKTRTRLQAKSFNAFIFCLIFILGKNIMVAQEFHGGDKPPIYVAGNVVLNDLIQKNLNYPDSIKKTGISGTVLLKLFISDNGKLENVKLIRGIHDVCDKEAVRVAWLLNDWQAAKRWGKPTGLNILLPIEFHSDVNYDYEQSMIVEGFVTEKSTGKPIDGALILIKGTNNGTTTNEEGKYRIEIPKESTELEISSIGYIVKNEVIGKNNTINIELDSDYITINYNEKN
jgi:hypothetical protein